jgi:DNA-binding NtrC family response regulator
MSVHTGRIVAVIDDDQGSAFALSLLLRDWGYEVVLGSDADRVVQGLSERYGGGAPSAIIADFHLKGDNGIDAALTVRKSFGSGCPVIIVSGSRGGASARQASSHGFPILLKPFEPEKLRGVLRRLVA